jgi:hypothetical protein
MSVTAVPIRPLKRGSLAKLWIGIAALSLAAAAAAWQSTGRLRYEKTPSGTEYQVVESGEGATPGSNDIARVHVVIRERGRIVQDSRSGEPQELPVGQLPPPIAEVLQVMNKGSTYKMRLTPEQMSGGQGAPPPPGAQPVSVELTLVDFRPISAEEQRQMEMMRMMQQQMQQRGAPGAPGAGAPGTEGGAPPGAPGAPEGGAREPAPKGGRGR